MFGLFPSKPERAAIYNGLFVKLFCLLLPFGLLAEFDKLNERVTGYFARKYGVVGHTF